MPPQRIATTSRQLVMKGSLKKRKHVTLTIIEKMNILKKNEKGASVKSLSEQYGVGNSTIYDIKKQRDELVKFYTESASTRDICGRKTLHRAKSEEHDKVLYEWFRQRRCEGASVSGPMLMVQAKQFHEDMKLTVKCDYSKGWLQRFKARHGIHLKASFEQEQLSADREAAEQYFNDYEKLVADKGLNAEQTYHCDETAVEWRNLPRKTVSWDEEKESLPQQQCPAPMITDIGQLVSIGDTDMVVTAVGSNDDIQNSIHPFDTTEVCVSSPSVFDVSQGVQSFSKVDQPRQMLKETDMLTSQVSPLQRSSRPMRKHRKWRRESTGSTVGHQGLGLVTDRDSMAPNSKVAKSDANDMLDAELQEAIVFPQSTNAATQKKRTLTVPNHQVVVMSNLLSMWKAGRLCDFYISNGSTDIMVHKMVLGAVCPKVLPILHNTSSSSFPKVTFPSSISKEGLLAFAEYMYSGVLDLNHSILVQLKTIAQRLDMEDFEQLCSDELHKAKDAVSAMVDPLLTEPCTLSGLLSSCRQKTTDSRHSQNTTPNPLLKLIENINSSNSSNSQGVVSIDNLVTVGDLSPSSSSTTLRSALCTTTAGQVIDIKTELESDEETILTPNPQQLKIKTCNPVRDQLAPLAGNSSTSRGDRLPISYSTNHYRSQSNPAFPEAIHITNLHHSEGNRGGADGSNNAGDRGDLQLVPITSMTNHCTIPSDIKVTTSIDNFVSYNSGLVNIPSKLATHIDLSPTTSNSIPYPVGLFTADGSKITQVLQKNYI